MSLRECEQRLRRGVDEQARVPRPAPTSRTGPSAAARRARARRRARVWPLLISVRTFAGAFDRVVDALQLVARVRAVFDHEIAQRRQVGGADRNTDRGDRCGRARTDEPHACRRQLLASLGRFGQRSGSGPRARTRSTRRARRHAAPMSSGRGRGSAAGSEQRVASGGVVGAHSGGQLLGSRDRGVGRLLASACVLVGLTGGGETVVARRRARTIAVVSVSGSGKSAMAVAAGRAACSARAARRAASCACSCTSVRCAAVDSSRSSLAVASAFSTLVSAPRAPPLRHRGDELLAHRARFAGLEVAGELVGGVRARARHRARAAIPRHGLGLAPRARRRVRPPLGPSRRQRRRRRADRGAGRVVCAPRARARGARVRRRCRRFPRQSASAGGSFRGLDAHLVARRALARVNSSASTSASAGGWIDVRAATTCSASAVVRWAVAIASAARSSAARASSTARNASRNCSTRCSSAARASGVAKLSSSSWRGVHLDGFAGFLRGFARPLADAVVDVEIEQASEQPAALGRLVVQELGEVALREHDALREVRERQTEQPFDRRFHLRCARREHFDAVAPCTFEHRVGLALAGARRPGWRRSASRRCRT